jgi:uncharacterized protein YcnI
MVRRLLFGLAAVIGVVAFVPGVASAHVHVDGDDLTQGGEGTLTFQVPNERDDADTVKVDVKLPSDTPIASVSVKPVPGWTAEVKTKKLAKPIATDEGEITEAPTEIIWSGGKIAAGQFQEFEISAGPFPEVDSLTFPTIQTYSDGKEVAWIEETPASGKEPEKPAPVIELAKASGDGAETATSEVAGSGGSSDAATDTASQDDVDSANSKALVGSILGLLGLILGTTAIVLTVRNKRHAS